MKAGTRPQQEYSPRWSSAQDGAHSGRSGAQALLAAFPAVQVDDNEGVRSGDESEASEER